jgi:hypothetical protein
MNHSNELPVQPATSALPATENFSDPKFREKLRAQLRAEEWAMHKELMAAARTALKILSENPHKGTAADVARIIDLADKLGRLATESANAFELPNDGTVVMLQFESALKTVYARRAAEGKPLPPGAVVDVESTAMKEQSVS